MEFGLHRLSRSKFLGIRIFVPRGMRNENLMRTLGNGDPGFPGFPIANPSGSNVYLLDFMGIPYI